MEALELLSVTRRFGSLTAVEDVTLSVHPGEMYALVGPDGAGKTTTIRMLCGITLPTSGEVRVLGYDVRTQPDEVRKRIGYLSQKFSLYGDLTVDENIEFFAEIHGLRNYAARRNELLEFTRLTPFRTRLAERLSGGMKQKLALACTLIHTPKVIFLDEPTTGVDPVSRRDFWKVLSSLLKTGITILMTTPYLDEAERCNRVALMNEGKILMADAPDRVRESMRGEIVEIVCTPIRDAFALLKTHPAVREVQAFGDRVNVVVANAKKDFPGIRRLLTANRIAISDTRTIPPTLENVFISLMTEKAPSTESEAV